MCHAVRRRLGANLDDLAQPARRVDPRWVQPVSGRTRHAARLGAISGKHKSDVTDANMMMLSMAADVFTLSPLTPPDPAGLALRRAVVRRKKLVSDGHRARRRLISLARWGLPGGVDRVRRVLAHGGRGPDPLAAPARRGGCETLQRDRCRGRAHPWRARRGRTGRGDPHGLPPHGLTSGTAIWTWTPWAGRSASKHLHDITLAGEQIQRATTQDRHYRKGLYGDDPLLLSL